MYHIVLTLRLIHLGEKLLSKSLSLSSLSYTTASASQISFGSSLHFSQSLETQEQDTPSFSKNPSEYIPLMKNGLIELTGHIEPPSLVLFSSNTVKELIGKIHSAGLLLEREYRSKDESSAKFSIFEIFRNKKKATPLNIEKKIILMEDIKELLLDLFEVRNSFNDYFIIIYLLFANFYLH